MARRPVPYQVRPADAQARADARSQGDAVADGDEPLTPDRRLNLATGFRTLIEGLYAHLPQKRASYGFDPSQRLRLLGERAGDTDLDDATFHREMAQVLTDLRDAHTRYLSPGPSESAAAFLPLLVERYHEGDGRAVFIASKVEGRTDEQRTDFKKARFESGVRLTHWNGVPIERAVELYADHETGGRPDARIARALESLTLRPLRYALPPEEDWVDIRYLPKKADGDEDDAREIRLWWEQIELPDPNTPSGPAALALAYNPVASRGQKIKKWLFANEVWKAEQAAIDDPTEVATSVEENVPEWKPTCTKPGVWLKGRFEPNVRARIIEHDGIEYGHLRIYSFQLRNDEAFIEEICELLDAMPPTGLIVDLRTNPGGLVWAAEGLLQLLTPNRIEPTRFSMLATDMTRAMATAPQNRTLNPWAESLRDAASTGVTHSRAVPLTPLSRCNNRGQRYGGPVVAIVDANTYSAGDLFAAGFVDNEVGKLVCTDAATGGGGANVWTFRDVVRALDQTQYELPELGDVSFTVSVRRAERARDAGTDIEDTGVTGSFRHRITKRDLTEENADLMAYAAGLLATEVVTSMNAEVTEKLIDDAATKVIEVTTTGLDRIVLDIDGVPHASLDLDDDGNEAHGAEKTVEIVVEAGWDQHKLELTGYDASTVRQRRLVEV